MMVGGSHQRPAELSWKSDFQQAYGRLKTASMTNVDRRDV